jgi:hypothetical protein
MSLALRQIIYVMTTHISDEDAARISHSSYREIQFINPLEPSGYYMYHQP